ncbi:MAG: DUF4190 domain-containing protein, partial [Verrucomicrobia bacterium]|nr:DUF4190 domain-containing protein [Verrucomicrobiota bacterium]
CNNLFVVPAAPAPVAVAVPTGRAPLRPAVPAPSAPPPPPPAPMRSAAGQTRTSKLAIASLVCSIGSFLIIPFGFIPGIICGHMAKKRIARDAMLGGRGLAKAGLIVGYVALTISVVAFVVVLVFLKSMGSEIAKQVAAASAQKQPLMRPGRPGPAVIPGGPTEQAADSGPVDTTPDAAGWTLQLKSASIPAAPVTGRIKGRDFNSEKVSVENGFLIFRQGADFFADLEMSVVLFVNLPAELSGKTFTVPNREPGNNPHIWMKWKPNGKDMPEQKSWMDGYAMRLEFGKMLNGKLPGKIYLCVPDQEKSFIRGTFEVALRREVGGGAVPPNGAAPIRRKRP